MLKFFSHAYLSKSYAHFLKTALNSKLGGRSIIKIIWWMNLIENSLISPNSLEIYIKVGVTSKRVGGA
jgi:hypothetical protein